MKKKKWVFTFGIGNPWFFNSVFIVEGTYIQAREFVMNEYGNKWCGQYDLAKFPINDYQVVGNKVIKLNENGHFKNVEYLTV